MKYKLIIDPEKEESVIITAHQKNSLILEIEKLLSKTEVKLYGYKDSEIILLNEIEIYAFYTSENKVYAHCKTDSYQLKERLYQLEEMFKDTFMKINQGCLVNCKKIKRFEPNIGGSIKVVLTNDYADYISRRELQNVKRRMGL